MAMWHGISKVPTIINSNRLHLKGRAETSKYNIHKTVTCKRANSMHGTESDCTDFLTNGIYNNRYRRIIIFF